MQAGFISEWWPASNRNGGRLHVGIPGRNKSESAAGTVPVVGAGSLPVELLRNSFATQSPAHSLVPLTVPTSLHPVGAIGLTWTSRLPPTVGALGAPWANALVVKNSNAAPAKICFIVIPTSR